MALASLAVAAPASAQPTKPYTLNIAPGTPTYESAPGLLASGQSVGITATFKNETSTQQMGSANLFWPMGFNVTRVSASVGTASIDSSTSGPKTCTYQGAAFGPCVQLRNLSLPPGQSVIVTMTVTTPGCQQGTFGWLAEPKQANNFSGSPGNDLVLDAANSNLNSSLDGACSLSWTTEPNSAKTNATITSNSYSAGNAPAVTVLDQNGDPVTTSTAPMTVALANNLFAMLDGTLNQQADGSTGTASFGDLSINAPATGYKLNATSGTLTGATSSPFNITDQVVGCTQNDPTACVTNDGTQNGNNAKVSATPTSTGLLLESVNADNASQLICAGYTSADPNTYQFSTPEGWGKTVTLTIRPLKKLSGQNTNKILAAQQICLGAPADFTTASGTQAAPGTLPDGTSGFIGLLPDCAKNSTGPCHARSQDTTIADPLSPNGFDLVLAASIPAAFPGDPHMS
jgi:hypothetical protein